MGILFGSLFVCIMLGVAVWMLAEYPRTLLVSLVFLLLVASCYESEAAPLDCMPSVSLPTPQECMVGGAAAFDVPAGTFGGGAFDWATWLALGCLVMLAYIASLYERQVATRDKRIAELEALQAPAFATLDISSFEPTESEDPFRRSITIEFTSLAGMVDFGHWLIEARRRLQRDGWPAVKS